MFEFFLSSQSLEKFNLKDSLKSSKAGAVSTFEGIVRNTNDGKCVTGLEYEAYEELCQREIQKIFSEVRTKFQIISLKCVHRTGHLNVGEMAVWIGCLAGHRDEAFKACRYVIDEIKKRLPIWKKEFYTNGDSGWVNTQSVAYADHETLSVEMKENKFYARQIILPEIGKDGQSKLKNAKVLVVGAGGLGSSALLALAGAGIGTIGICEYDALQESNLHRQFLYSYADVGKAKIDLAMNRVKSLNPYIDVKTYPFKLDDKTISETFRSYDAILDCTDNFKTKFLINDECVKQKKILIQASIYQWEGQLRIYIPELSGCLRCLWPQIPGDDCIGNCAEVGVLGTVPSLLGNLQAHEAIKYFLNGSSQLNTQTCIIDLSNLHLSFIDNFKSDQCPVCSGKQIQTITIETPILNNTLTIDISTLDEEKLNEFTLIDIRESAEIIVNPIKNLKTTHLALSQFDHSNFVFEPNQKYLIICGKGLRSERLVNQLNQKEIKNVFSLKGGTLALNQYFQEKLQVSS